MASDAPWFKFYPSDWLSGTRGLSAVETGIYITLISTMYDSGGPIPNDAVRLARICGATGRQFAKALSSLMADGKIVVTDAGELFNARVADEMQKFAAKRCQAKEAAETRWEKKDEENQSPDDATASAAQCGTDAILEARSQKPERENARAQGHREVAQEILKDRAFTLSPWEDGFLANIAQVKRLSAEQKTQFEAISARWKGKQANAPPAVPRIAIAEGTPEFAAWERHLGRQAPRTDVRLDTGRLARGWYFPSLTPPPPQDRAA